jgi:hypothetical protein
VRNAYDELATRLPSGVSRLRITCFEYASSTGETVIALSVGRSVGQTRVSSGQVCVGAMTGSRSTQRVRTRRVMQLLKLARLLEFHSNISVVGFIRFGLLTVAAVCTYTS